ncbi:MAG: hypothetical protein ACK5Q5_18885 [Planctomycetaceae bacterium]
MTEPRTTYTDADLTFYLQVCRDYRRAEWCLDHLRAHFPAARVIVISDGDPDPRFESFVPRFSVEYRAGERLYGLEHGGRMIARMLSAWECSSDFLFKIDPDTLVHRRFRWLPCDNLAVFGMGLPTQGGVMGFTRAAGERLLQSRLLASPLLTDPARSWGVMADGAVNADLLKMVQSDGRIRFDWVLAWCCRQLGIPQIWFDEVFSVWRDPVPEDIDVALSHPHTDIPIDREEL